ncbi:MAG: radical SAM protein [Dehalococcoidia bacterium]|nr:radical SAM protein [Dehalococcoidia bacterium]MDW8120151.1 radical SAM protein [Chloroflexota bacterium]
MNARARYQEIRCRTALNRVEGMGFRWSLNPYRGCVHSCHYCFARRYHAFLDLSAGEDFSGIVFVKVNIPQVLRWEVWSPTWRKEEVVIGTATDPYQPIEGKYRLTRSCLEVLCQVANPMSLVTKGTMVVRDTDVLADLSRRAGCSVCISVPTLDTAIWRRMEPGTPPPQKRLWAVERLAQAGVRAGVLIAPIVPGLTDGPFQLAQVVRAAKEHGASFVGASLLRLQSGVREHFLQWLGGEFPHLRPIYQRLYTGAYVPWRFQSAVLARVEGLKQRYGLAERPQPGASAPRQLAFAL